MGTSLSPGVRLCGYIRVMDVREKSDEQVYAEHAADVVRFAGSLVGHADAPDVATEAFVRLCAKPVWLRARNPKALWMRAVVFEAQSWNRANRRRRARERSVAPATTVTDDADLGDPRIDAALERLPLQQRAVLMLTYWMDLDPAAVAEVLGVSEGSVRKQLARARSRLREALT